MPKIFIVWLSPGANWDASRGSREQQHWDAHASFMDDLFERGMVVLGGPLADRSGALVIVEATDESEVRVWFRNDPWTIHDVLPLKDVKEWHILLDGRTKHEAGGPQ